MIIRFEIDFDHVITRPNQVAQLFRVAEGNLWSSRNSVISVLGVVDEAKTRLVVSHFLDGEVESATLDIGGRDFFDDFTVETDLSVFG